MAVSLSQEILVSHKPIIDLWQEMKADRDFERLCRKSGLPWDFDGGYEPRWYNGPRPDRVKVLFLMAEPGAIGENEKGHLRAAISNDVWPEQDTETARQKENYWREHLYQVCSNIWTEDTRGCMNRYLAGSCTFWMSLPDAKKSGSGLHQTSQVPREVDGYFLERYLHRFLGLFPASTIILAAGRKAVARLNRLKRITGAEFQKTVVTCRALTRPEANKARAREDWARVGKEIRLMLSKHEPT